MLIEIVKVISRAQTNAQEGTLFCNAVLIDSDTQKTIEFLEERNIIENTNYSNKLGEIVALELSLSGLNGIGYYYKKDDLIRKNRYTYPADLFYVAELGKFSNDLSVQFYTSLAMVQSFIHAIDLV